ncbi:MAG: hypothetical protein JZU65_05620 [Chlorobium sp.]|nr:hypothetical protein [Chlorobium sp.]
MPTSGISTFINNRDSIVRRALRIVGAFTSTDIPRPEQLVDAIQILNTMLKTWSTEGYLWLRQFHPVTLIAATNSYQLGPASPIPMDRPVHVFNANRKSASGNEIPMIQLTRSEWMTIPNKTTQSTPVQFYYDAQTVNGVLYVWPMPQVGTTDTLVLDIDRQLDIMADNLDDFDFPPQWYDAIVYSLAVRLAPEYGMPLSERQLLHQEAAAFLASVSNDDRDLGSIHFEVRR